MTTTSWLARLVTAAFALLATAWLAWPLWSSETVADRPTLSGETPWLLGAELGLLVLLAFTLWLAAGRTVAPYAPVPFLAAGAVFATTFLHPGSNGIEVAYLFPFVAGALLGSPAGCLTGAAAALLTATVGGTIADPLVGQMLVWASWGVFGGWLRPLSTRVTWWLGAALCLPLGLLSGVLLNLTGWAGETSADVGAFLPGAPPFESAKRLIEYVWATSFGYDLTRGVFTGLAFLALGGPLLTVLRRGFDTRRLPSEVSIRTTPRISTAARGRRDQLPNLWQPTQGDPDD